MNELTLFDLECIIVDKENEEINVEMNEEKIYNVDPDELWKKIHSNDIKVAEICGDIVYIKLFNSEKNKDEELIMFL